MKAINISEFKAKCLGILEEVARTGEGITILKYGKPIAQVTAAVPREADSPQATLHGTVEILDDVLAPVLPAGAWEAESGDGEEDG